MSSTQQTRRGVRPEGGREEGSAPTVRGRAARLAEECVGLREGLAVVADGVAVGPQLEHLLGRQPDLASEHLEQLRGARAGRLVEGGVLVEAPEGELDRVALRQGVVHLVEVSVDRLLPPPPVVDEALDERRHRVPRRLTRRTALLLRAGAAAAGRGAGRLRALHARRLPRRALPRHLLRGGRGGREGERWAAAKRRRPTAGTLRRLAGVCRREEEEGAGPGAAGAVGGGRSRTCIIIICA